MKLGFELPIIVLAWMVVSLCIIAISQKKMFMFWKRTILLFIAVSIPVVGIFYPMPFYLWDETIPVHYVGAIPFKSLCFLGGVEKFKFILLNLVLFLPLGMVYRSFFQNTVKRYVMEVYTIIAFVVLLFMENHHARVVVYSWDLGICLLNWLSLKLGCIMFMVYRFMRKKRGSGI